jgi:PilZ domain
MSRSLRRHDRYPAQAQIFITWTGPDGIPRLSRGKCLDVSESGLLIEAQDPIPERIYVFFRSEALHLEGSASVRHCVRYGVRHRIGLEFSGGLKYKGVAG